MIMFGEVGAARCDSEGNMIRFVSTALNLRYASLESSVSLPACLIILYDLGDWFL